MTCADHALYGGSISASLRCGGAGAAPRRRGRPEGVRRSRGVRAARGGLADLEADVAHRFGPPPTRSTTRRRGALHDDGGPSCKSRALENAYNAAPRGCGGIGRRARFRSVCPKGVEVQVLSSALWDGALTLTAVFGRRRHLGRQPRAEPRPDHGGRRHASVAPLSMLGRAPLAATRHAALAHIDAEQALVADRIQSDLPGAWDPLVLPRERPGRGPAPQRGRPARSAARSCRGVAERALPLPRHP